MSITKRTPKRLKYVGGLAMIPRAYPGSLAVKYGAMPSIRATGLNLGSSACDVLAATEARAGNPERVRGALLLTKIPHRSWLGPAPARSPSARADGPPTPARGGVGGRTP